MYVLSVIEFWYWIERYWIVPIIIPPSFISYDFVDINLSIHQIRQLDTSVGCYVLLAMTSNTRTLYNVYVRRKYLNITWNLERNPFKLISWLYLLVLMNSFVDITAKRRRHQLSLHPSSDVSPLYARYILAWSKPEPNWMLFMQFS